MNHRHVAFAVLVLAGLLAAPAAQASHQLAWESQSAASDNDWRDLAWSPELGIFAAVASSGTGDHVMTSPDGITWTPRTAPSNATWFAIAWSPELSLYAATATFGPGDRVMTSPDGITWTSRTAASGASWRDIAWSPELGLFAAVANSGGTEHVMTSPDGITWTLRTTPDLVWFGIAWSPELSLFAAVANTGSGDRVMTSPDGITWTSQTSAADNEWIDIAWSPELELFAAVAVTGAGDRVMTSPDGETWTLRSSAADNSWVSVAWSPELGLFAAVAISGSGDRVMTSPDGITWTSQTSAADNDWFNIAWSPELGIFAAVASSGTGDRVMTSSQPSHRGLHVVDYQVFLATWPLGTGAVPAMTVDVQPPHSWDVASGRSVLEIKANYVTQPGPVTNPTANFQVFWDGQGLADCAWRIEGGTVGGLRQNPHRSMWCQVPLVAPGIHTIEIQRTAVTGDPIVTATTSIILHQQETVLMDLDVNTALDFYLPFLFWGLLALWLLTREPPALFPALVAIIMFANAILETTPISTAFGLLLFIVAVLMHSIAVQGFFPGFGKGRDRA